ncbi:MAG: argininosuccinate lyase [Candidatus Saganbacteria bacterium]|nr:argininosuccinate lyase [Candidatus Saganbacteria bacterium]
MKKKTFKAWAGRFSMQTAKSVEEYTASIDIDSRLAKYDVASSVAYAKALVKVGVLSSRECGKIVKALTGIKKSIETGKIKFKKELEDVHMNIEKLLIDEVGEAGKKLHTGRSRNDQVVTDLRMYLKDEIVIIIAFMKKLQRAILDTAEENMSVVMPGYTHLQRAQPVLYSHYLMAYFEMLDRDRQRMLEAFMEADVMPLGSAALAGSGYKIDRNALAKELGFSHLSRNSIDAVSDRDFVISFEAAAAILIMHLSRLCEELILWSTYEFSFVELSDAFTTGSSIMPQKKNPDVAELVRGKTGRIYGNLVGILTIMKALPLAYNKDMQEDKVPLFDTVDTLKSTLSIMEEMLRTMKVKKEIMEKASRKGFLTATDLAYYLVKKGVPFREAHGIVGKIIRFCIDSNMDLEYLSIKELKKFCPKFEHDARQALFVDASIKARDIVGGTAPKRVKDAIVAARRRIAS